MAQYIIIYLGGDQPESAEAGKKHFAQYQQWLLSLGDSVISPMNPIKNTQTVNPDTSISSQSKTLMSGYTIIEAESMDVALSIAKFCPFLKLNGSLEVSQLIEMTAK
ncbi:YciI family protein [Pseudoalteromonas denitrificans]|uniref:YCII-related domain-containing protein n=1 Tax=Pseudoalteromonas denitrificans DSM 6059 TaxID=1123010 RepID=A0A1I1KD45_9GAMM|nr:YciI family protein [Pseudoalteromonas denitrificans]SFC58759.1 YCII-related domain-containing protein [Pseudoalteromonas denitrificans DSM 6059]